MRQAATAAIDLCYAGVADEQSAKAAGLLWNNNAGNPGQCNAYGVYDPASGKFFPRSSRDAKNVPYGKGTARDGGTEYTMGNDRGSYNAKLDYTKAFVMVSIYPLGNDKHVDVYWKGKDGKYVGGSGANGDDPKYSIRVPFS